MHNYEMSFCGLVRHQIISSSYNLMQEGGEAMAFHRKIK